MSGRLFNYRISGLGVHSELWLAGAISAENVIPEILVRQRPVSARLNAPLLKGPDWEMDESRFLFWIEGIGRFLVANGRTMDVELFDLADPSEASLYLTGTGLGALLLQRGDLILHASAISHNGQAIALCGESGAGKSTLAAAFCEAGWNFISDDLSRLELDAGGRPVVWPDGRSLKLFAQSIERLALANRCGREVRAGLGKHYIAPRFQSSDPVALSAVYLLRYHEQVSTDFVRLSCLDAAQALLDESHRPTLALALARSSRHVAVTASVVSRVPIFELKRPRGLTEIEATAGAVIAHREMLNAAPANLAKL